MNFICQKEALDNLKLLAEHNQHGVLIIGDPGSGKTYLARQYAKMLSIPDFYIINPVMSDLKAMIEGCVSNGTSVVLCIEDLDSGVVQTAYPLLKLIEDCPSFIYIVVTCNNLYSIPDTIPSRCALVTINPPTATDMLEYAKTQEQDAACYKHKVWSCVRSFTDADTAIKFSPDHLKHFDSLPAILNAKNSSVSNTSWKLTHYDDNSEIPVVFVLRYLMLVLTGHRRTACIECLNDLADSRISQNAVLSKFIFEVKYTE